MSGTTSRRLAGVTSMTIDGVAWDVVSDAKWRPSGNKNETLTGQTRVEGYKQLPQPGMMGAKLRDQGGAQLQQFQGSDGHVVVIQQANGKLIYGDGMWTVEVSETDTAEGTFDISFEGDDVSELVAS